MNFVLVSVLYVKVIKASCIDELGDKQARLLVNQCIEISPATHPPCHVSNPCSLITDEIKRGCAAFAGDPRQPNFCLAQKSKAPLQETTTKPTQTNFDSFWQKFKADVKSKDKNQVADFTKFPYLEYNPTSDKPQARDRAAFIKDYDAILNGEADPLRCFEKNKPVKEDEKTYL